MIVRIDDIVRPVGMPVVVLIVPPIARTVPRRTIQISIIDVEVVAVVIVDEEIVSVAPVAIAPVAITVTPVAVDSDIGTIVAGTRTISTNHRASGDIRAINNDVVVANHRPIPT